MPEGGEATQAHMLPTRSTTMQLNHVSLNSLESGLHSLEPAEFQHWMAIGERMREEAREEAEEMVQAVASVVQRMTGKIPPIYIREGKVAEELIKLIDEEQNIALLVLGAATGTDGPGPLIETLVEKQAGRLRVPVTIVPGNLSDAQLDAIC